jgi:hypothetical protein
MAEIKHRYTGQVIASGDTLKAAATANLKHLRDANLRGANFRGADLCGADLRGANFRDAKLSWQSHDLLSEILRRDAGDDIAKLKIAGLILVLRDKCWDDFGEMAARDPLGEWALDALAEWVQDGGDAPQLLRDRAHSTSRGNGEEA